MDKVWIMNSCSTHASFVSLHTTVVAVEQPQDRSRTGEQPKAFVYSREKNERQTVVDDELAVLYIYVYIDMPR
jgi:hypothetical protein